MSKEMTDSKKEAESNSLKSYRVTLKSTLYIDIDVKAESMYQAEEKAFQWTDFYHSGDSKIGDYRFNNDNDEFEWGYDDGYLHWDISGEEFRDIFESIELSDGEEA